MTGSEVIQYLETLPQRGIVEFDLSDETLFVVMSSAEFGLSADGSLIIDGLLGYGSLHTAKGSLLLDPDQINYVKYVEEVPS